MKIDFKKLIASLLICFVPGIIGSAFTFSKITTWYANINKPSFTPPNFIFGPVWTLLYIILGISLYLIWNKIGDLKNKTVYLFFIQLFLNSIWTILFFGFNLLLISYIEIIILGIFIIINMITFYKKSKTASLILIPYMLWIIFASFLTLFVYLLN